MELYFMELNVFCILHKVLYHKNSKMRFLGNHDNGQIDHFLRLQYASFEPCPGYICDCF